MKDLGGHFEMIGGHLKVIGDEKKVIGGHLKVIAGHILMIEPHRRYIFFVTASATLIALVLLSDRDGLIPQLLLGGITAAFLVYFARRSPVDGRQIAAAVIIATTGEIVLSLGWKLYSYRHAVIPFYVPPGHGLVYLLAAETSLQPRLQKWGRGITLFVVLAGTSIAVVSVVAFGDSWGLLWWLVALAFLSRTRNGLLLSACFTYTMLLEWAGTANGNWRWAEVVPYVGLRSANPPAGVGLLYIILDVLVILVTSRMATTLSRSSSYQPM